MFAVHTPQSITLAVPGEDGPFTLINFRVNGADTSRCVMEIVTPDGDTHRLTFTTRGALVDQQFIDKDSADAEPVQDLPGEAFMENGRDTRADNAYTHVAPVDADTAYRDGQNPGHKSPVPETDEERAHREEVYAEADKAKKQVREKALKHQQEIQERSGARKTDPSSPSGYAGHSGDLKTADDTTEADLAWDAPHPVASDQTFPQGRGEADPYGRSSTGDVVPNPDRSPMAPPPSSPLPGSPPAHPLDRPDLGRVNTTRSLQEPRV